MSALLTYHPFKALYVLLATSFEAARLPLWVLLYATSFGRPHKGWTFVQAMMMKITSRFLVHATVIEIYTPYNLKPGAEKERYVTYGPAPSDTYNGPCKDKEILPAKIGGTWTPKAPTAAEIAQGSIDVVCHFHGGAFVIGDGRDADTGFLAKTMLKHARVTHVFTPNYRLSSNPGGRFPAAFQDTITSYHYLVKILKIPASRITVSGDSAGGNLALALLRYLSQHGEEADLPSSGCAWLWSPWVNIDAARDPKSIANSPQYGTDYLNAGFGMWGARTIAPLGKGFDPASPYITPFGHPFKSKTPLWIQTGDAEVLYDDDKEISEQLEKAGNKVELSVSKNCPHDIILVGPLTGFAKEAAEAAKKAGEFLRAERVTS